MHIAATNVVLGPSNYMCVCVNDTLMVLEPASQLNLNIGPDNAVLGPESQSDFTVLGPTYN